MREIRNYEDLIREKLLLEGELRREKAMMASQINIIKEKLEPLQKAFGFVEKLGFKGNGGSLIKMGTDLTVDMFVRPRLAKAGFVTKLLVPALIKGVGALFGRRKNAHS